MSESHPESGGQPVRSQHVSARVPDRVSRGAFSTGVIVMTGGTEFILDFVQNLGRPHAVVSRVVMPHAVLPQFIDALVKNIDLYKQRFGPPPELPKPPQSDRKPTAQEIYDELKLPDEQLSGAYANGVMIGHSGAEFSFDFLTNFFPHSAVSSRVFLSAAQVPRLLESLQGTYQQFQQRVKQQMEEQQRRQSQNPPPPPPESTDGP